MLCQGNFFIPFAHPLWLEERRATDIIRGKWWENVTNFKRKQRIDLSYQDLDTEADTHSPDLSQDLDTARKGQVQKHLKNFYNK